MEAKLLRTPRPGPDKDRLVTVAEQVAYREVTAKDCVRPDAYPKLKKPSFVALEYGL